MKDQRDPGTVELTLQPKRSRGRPRKPDALTPAERAKRYRQRKRLASTYPLQDAFVEQVIAERDDQRAINAELRAELVKLQAQFKALIGR